MENKDFELAKKVIFDNLSEFENLRISKSKLYAVKMLKDLTGFGLKDSKDIINMFFQQNLSFIQLSRKDKLEKLSKKPLVELIVSKIKELENDKLEQLFMNMPIDLLLVVEENIK